MDRYEHVPTLPADGGKVIPGDHTILGDIAIGGGGFWPGNSCSTADLRGCESEMPGDD